MLSPTGTAKAKVGHRQTPYKQPSPPREGFAVFIVGGLKIDLLKQSDNVPKALLRRTLTCSASYAAAKVGHPSVNIKGKFTRIFSRHADTTSLRPAPRDCQYNSLRCRISRTFPLTWLGRSPSRSLG